MDQIEIYVALLGIIVTVGIIFSKVAIPTSLLLVITGMLLSLAPGFPHVVLDPNLVLYIFLPLLIYQTSSFTSWREIKSNFRLISLLSVGHVIFITCLVAVTAHALIPDLSWPLAFVLGAVISPPDDVAVVNIAQKIHLPRRVVTVLNGEGMLNDATALILFRFALAAILTNYFSPAHAIANFFIIIIGETAYGLMLGFLLGELRLKLKDPTLQMTISLLTPFLAYLPPAILGGSGVLATVVTGLFIGNVYLDRFPPDVRLTALSVWSTIVFAVQGILFLLVGLDLLHIAQRIAVIPSATLALYSITIILVVIVGRFIWVYPSVYIPKFFARMFDKREKYSPWQFPFIISWAGMRGGVSLAAALAVPTLPLLADGTNPKDLLVFLVFCVIIATLVLQGLALPWVLNVFGIIKYGMREKRDEHRTELLARIEITKAVSRWLSEYKTICHSDLEYMDEVKFRIQEYQTQKKQLEEQVKNHNKKQRHDETAELKQLVHLSSQLLEVERTELARLWREKKIDLTLRNKLLQQLDHRSKYLGN